MSSALFSYILMELGAGDSDGAVTLFYTEYVF